MNDFTAINAAWTLVLLVLSVRLYFIARRVEEVRQQQLKIYRWIDEQQRKQRQL